VKPGQVKVSITIEGHTTDFCIRGDLLDLPNSIAEPFYHGPDGTFTERAWEMRKAKGHAAGAFVQTLTSWGRARKGMP
jgi:hypothetical protein